MTEMPSERAWRLADRAEERAAAAAMNLDEPTRDRLLTRAAKLTEQAREAERRGQ